jgi:hypothetical protein
VTGEAALNPLPSGDVMLHAQLRGLDPSTEYTLLIYDASATCADATSSIQVITFKANPAGIATLNEKVQVDVATVQSLGVRAQPTNDLVACASVL